MFLQVPNSLGHLSRSHVRFFSKAFSIYWYDHAIFAFKSICKVYYSYWLKYVDQSRDHWEKVLLITVADLCNTCLHSVCKYLMRILPLCSLVILTCISFCCSLCLHLVWVVKCDWHWRLTFEVLTSSFSFYFSIILEVLVVKFLQKSYRFYSWLFPWIIK